MERLAAVSVDLDEIPCYTAIHGLPLPQGAAAHAIYERAVPRLSSLFRAHGVRATFFAVGRDAENPRNAATLRALVADGHEVASHSYSHYYDLTRRSVDAMRHEVAAAQEAIAHAVGARPRGFRAPGYTITDALFRVLEAEGLEWDSSVFPCPAYFAAKTAAIAAISLRGRTSRSIVDDPRVLTAPAEPYRIGSPYWQRGSGLLELPIGVTDDLTGRLPFIGTNVVMAGPTVASGFARMMKRRTLVSLELHGIDLADRDDDGLAFLAPHQPDLRTSLTTKRASLVAALDRLRRDGREFVTVSEAAERLAERV